MTFFFAQQHMYFMLHAKHRCPLLWPSNGTDLKANICQRCQQSQQRVLPMLLSIRRECGRDDDSINQSTLLFVQRQTANERAALWVSSGSPTTVLVSEPSCLSRRPFHGLKNMTFNRWLLIFFDSCKNIPWR